MSGKFRSAFVTSFNFPDPSTLEFTDQKVKAARWQLEKCPTTGKNHVHYAIWCTGPISFRTYQKWVQDEKANVQPLKNDEKARLYTAKLDSRIDGPWQCGEESDMVTQGQRTDLIELREAVKEGKSDRELIEDDNLLSVYGKYPRLVETMRRVYTKPRMLEENPEVIIYWGVSKSGKTHRAIKEMPNAFIKGNPTKWWFFYNGQEEVIINEFNPHTDQTSLAEWLQILDKWPYVVELKKGEAQLQAKKFIFTSNFNPDMWWNNSPQKDAFMRRVTKIVEFTEPYRGGNLPPQGEEM